MKQFTYLLTDPVGLHARPAGQLAKLAAGFACNIRLATPENEADAKRILAVMKLAAKQNTPLTITCEGTDEEAAAAAISEFLATNL